MFAENNPDNSPDDWGVPERLRVIQLNPLPAIGVILQKAYDSLNVIKAKILNISDLQSLTGHIVSSSVQLRLAGSAVLARLPNHQESHWGCFSQRFSNAVTEQGPLVMTSDPLESGRKFRSSEAAWDPAVCLL